MKEPVNNFGCSLSIPSTLMRTNKQWLFFSSWSKGRIISQKGWHLSSKSSQLTMTNLMSNVILDPTMKLSKHKLSLSGCSGSWTWRTRRSCQCWMPQDSKRSEVAQLMNMRSYPMNRKSKAVWQRVSLVTLMRIQGKIRWLWNCHQCLPKTRPRLKLLYQRRCRMKLTSEAW